MAIVLLYILGGLILTAGLVVISYLDRIYRDLARVTASRVHEHLALFESEIEPRLKIDRVRAGMAFSLLARLSLLLVAAAIVRSVLLVAASPWEAALESFLLLGAEVVVGMQLLPLLLLVGTRGQWLLPLVPALRILLWL